MKRFNENTHFSLKAGAIKQFIYADFFNRYYTICNICRTTLLKQLEAIVYWLTTDRYLFVVPQMRIDLIKRKKLCNY